MHACGYATSLHTIRSYSKLLVEGVTLIGAEIQEVLEVEARSRGCPWGLSSACQHWLMPLTAHSMRVGCLGDSIDPRLVSTGERDLVSRLTCEADEGGADALAAPVMRKRRFCIVIGA